MEKKQFLSKLMVLGGADVLLCACNPEKKETPKADVSALNKQENVIAEASTVAQVTAPSEVAVAEAVPAPEVIAVARLSDAVPTTDVSADEDGDDEDGMEEGQAPTSHDNQKKVMDEETPPAQQQQ
jgi:hypothetical protein